MKTLLKDLSPRDIIFVLSGTVLFLVCTPLLTGVFNSGSVGGMLIGAFFVFAGLKKLTFRRAFACKNVKGRTARVILRTAASLILLGFIWATFCGLFVVYKAVFPSYSGADGMTVVVLGCHVEGETPGRSLTKRIDRAYEILSENSGAYAVLTGGMGEGENVTEAYAMKKELTSRGIDPQRLILEENSTDTEENIAFAAGLIEERRLSKNVAVITQTFHQARASLYCEKYGLVSTPVNADTPGLLFPVYFIRELFGVTYYCFYR